MTGAKSIVTTPPQGERIEAVEISKSVTRDAVILIRDTAARMSIEGLKEITVTLTTDEMGLKITAKRR